MLSVFSVVPNNSKFPDTTVHYTEHAGTSVIDTWLENHTEEHKINQIREQLYVIHCSMIKTHGHVSAAKKYVWAHQCVIYVTDQVAEIYILHIQYLTYQI